MPKRALTVPPPRPEVVALLQTCKESPDDDTPRLVLADWLEDHGDTARAEFIRVQCELGKLPGADAQRPSLERREQRLLKQHENDWLGPLRGLAGTRTRTMLDPTTWLFRRGLLWVRLQARKAFLGRGMLAAVRCGAWDWVETLHLMGVTDRIAARLAQSALLQQLSFLDLRANGIGDAGIAALASSPNLRNLLRLDLRDNEIRGFGAAALLNSPYLEKLIYLNLDQNWGIGATEKTALQGRFGHRVCLPETIDMTIPF